MATKFFAVLLFLVAVGTVFGQSPYKATFTAPRRNGLYPRMDMVTPLPQIREFSLCYRTKLSRGNIHTIFSYEFNSTSKIEHYLDYKTKDPHWVLEQGFEIFGATTVNKTVVTSRCGSAATRWQHFCYLWSSFDGRMDVYHNGQLCETLHHAKGTVVQGGGTVRIGQQMPRVLGYGRQLEGEITDLHLFDDILTEKQIKAMADCNPKPIRGSLIEWLTTSFDFFDGMMLRNAHACL